MFVMSWISAKAHEAVDTTEQCRNSRWRKSRHRTQVVLLEVLSMPDNALKLQNNTQEENHFPSIAFNTWKFLLVINYIISLFLLVS